MRWLILLFLVAPLWAQAPAGFLKLSNVSALTYTDATCPDNINCAYVVTAVDSTGIESVPASCASGSTCVNGVEVLVAIPATGTHTVTLTWQASTSTGVTYNVYGHVGPFPASNIAGSHN